MRALSVAARAAIAGGVIVLGASCRPDRFTSPGADGIDDAAEVPTAQLGAIWGSATVDVKPDVDTLPLGAAKQLTMEVGGSRSVRAAIHWSSLDSSVVTINGSGVATAVNGGRARVVGKVGPAADTATLIVTVPVAGVTTSPESGALTVGQQAQLSATASDALGRAVPDAPVEWASLNTAVATVSSPGLVTGISEGDARIVARSGGKSDTSIVHVGGAPIASLDLSPATLALSSGATAQLTATSAGGATLGDRLATWTSSDEAVARVSATGQVTGMVAGTATVTATIDGKSATSTVTVTAAPVASLAVSANSTALTVGQTTQVNATARDASGATLAGRAVTWATSDAAVATVSPSGIVTAAAAGTARITGTSEGASASVTVTVTEVSVVTVTASVNASAVTVGQTTQASASAFDAAGQPIVGRAVTWAVDRPSVATIAATGQVTGVTAGMATVTATVDGKSGSVTVTVLAAPPVASIPTPSASPSRPPEMPRAEVDASPAPVTGSSIRVAAGQDLQAALDAARAGDELVLDAGATFTGNFVLRTSGITVRSNTALPPAGTRITPAAASSFAKILTPNIGPALATVDRVHHVQLRGVEVSAAPGLTHVYSLINLGDNSVAQTTVAQVPNQLVLDRVYVHGTATLDLRRCVALNSAWTAIVDSYLSDCHSNDGDAQAIWGSNGPGPFTIVNNRLEGSGENLMFGGDDSRAAAMVPSDITIRGNHLVKPLAWQGKWCAKNLLELKVGRRVLIEGNVLEHSWRDCQDGYAVVLWTVNQGGGAPWSETADVTVRLNRIQHAGNGFQLSARSANAAVPMARVRVEHNTIVNVGLDAAMGGSGRLFQVDGNVADLMFSRNSSEGNGPWLYFVKQPITPLDRMTVRDNLAAQSGLTMRSDFGNGAVAWDQYGAPGGGTITGNVVAGDFTIPAGNTKYVAGMNLTGLATDGVSAPGADVAAVASRASAAVAGVRAP